MGREEEGVDGEVGKRAEKGSVARWLSLMVVVVYCDWVNVAAGGVGFSECAEWQCVQTIQHYMEFFDLIPVASITVSDDVISFSYHSILFTFSFVSPVSSLTFTFCTCPILKY